MGPSTQSPPIWGGEKRFLLLPINFWPCNHSRNVTLDVKLVNNCPLLNLASSSSLQLQDLCQLGVPEDYFHKLLEAMALPAEKHLLVSCWGYAWQRVQLWFPLLELTCVFHEEARRQCHMDGRGSVVCCPKQKPLGCWVRFKLTVTLLNSSPATAVLEKETEDVSSTYLAVVIFYNLNQKKEKK